MWWDCPRLLITSLNYLASFPNLGLYFPFLMASQTPTHPSKPHSDVTSSKNCFPPCMSLRGWLSSFSAFTAQDQHHESPYHVVWKGGGLPDFSLSTATGGHCLIHLCVCSSRPGHRTE